MSYYASGPSSAPNGIGGSGQPYLDAAADDLQAQQVIVPEGPTNQPRLLVRSINENEAVFHLSGVELGYANSLRRVVQADVPTVGECCFSGAGDGRRDCLAKYDARLESRAVGIDCSVDRSNRSAWRSKELQRNGAPLTTSHRPSSLPPKYIPHP
jgi:hypothetical protein